MARFEIEVPELHWATKEVEAETIEEAFKKALEGDEDAETACEYSRTFEPSEVHWEGRQLPKTMKAEPATHVWRALRLNLGSLKLRKETAYRSRQRSGLTARALCF